MAVILARSNQRDREFGQAGHCTSDPSSPSPEILSSDGRYATPLKPAARKRLGSTVHATALADLSAVDRTYLLAMAQDTGPSNTGEIARRLGETVYYAGQYRLRLIDAGIIEPVGRGRVDFTIPYLREYLREHAARYEMAARRR